MRDLLSRKLPVAPLWFTLVAGLLLPVAAFMHAVFGFPYRLIPFSLVAACVTILSYEFFAGFTGKFDHAVGRLSSSFSILLYPGYLIMYLGYMTIWTEAGAYLSLFFMMVFGCDSGMVFGMILGNNRAFASQQSLAGFFGGYAIAGLLPRTICSIRFRTPPSPCDHRVRYGNRRVIGDIFESVLNVQAVSKIPVPVYRAAGVLDGIDSVLWLRRFYVLTSFLFGL